MQYERRSLERGKPRSFSRNPSQKKETVSTARKGRSLPLLNIVDIPQKIPERKSSFRQKSYFCTLQSHLMRKAGKKNRFKANVAWAVLCVHLFGMVVTNVLHPLYHAHSPDSCYSGSASASSGKESKHFSSDKKTTQAQTAAGHSCTLCQWKVSHEFVFEEYRDPVPCSQLSSLCPEFITNPPRFDPQNDLRPRAPPLLG